MTLCAAIIGANKAFCICAENISIFTESCKMCWRSAGKLVYWVKISLNKDLDLILRSVWARVLISAGESSALLESLEGKIGIPRNRPPSAVIRGYWAIPPLSTTLNLIWRLQLFP